MNNWPWLASYCCLLTWGCSSRLLWSSSPPALWRCSRPASWGDPGSGSCPPSRRWSPRRTHQDCGWDYNHDYLFDVTVLFIVQLSDVQTHFVWGRRRCMCWGWGSCSPGTGRARGGSCRARRGSRGGSRTTAAAARRATRAFWHENISQNRVDIRRYLQVDVVSVLFLVSLLPHWADVKDCVMRGKIQ